MQTLSPCGADPNHTERCGALAAGVPRVTAKLKAPYPGPPCPCSLPRVSIKFIWRRAAQGLLGRLALANEEAGASGARSGRQVVLPERGWPRRLQCQVRGYLAASVCPGLVLEPAAPRLDGFRSSRPEPCCSHFRWPRGSQGRLTPAT